MEEGGEPPFRRPVRVAFGCYLFDDQDVLGDGEGVVADRLAVPARDAGEAVGDILDFDIARRGIEQVEAAARQHALPGARGVASDRLIHVKSRFGAIRHRGSLTRSCSFAHGSWRWQVTRWSLTMPTDCMKA